MLPDTSLVYALFPWVLVAAKVHAAPILPAFPQSNFAVNTSIVIIGPLAFSLAPLALGSPSTPVVIPPQTTTVTEVVTATVALSQPPVTVSITASASTVTQIVTVTSHTSLSSSKPLERRWEAREWSRRVANWRWRLSEKRMARVTLKA